MYAALDHAEKLQPVTRPAAAAHEWCPKDPNVHPSDS